MIKNVLVAVDGSENSERALDFALDFAEKYGAILTILNVSQSPSMGAVPLDSTTVSGESMVGFAKDLQKLHSSILDKAVSHAKQVKPDAQIFSKLKEGNPAVEIVATAKEGGFDVVVVGHRGLGRMQEMFLGNISEKVAHSAPCPVIIIR